MGGRSTRARGSWVRRGGGKTGSLLLALAALLTLAAALAGCDAAKNDQPNAQALADLSWCDRPLISFQDNSKQDQPTITSWDAVKGQLGFTPRLPETFPNGSCLNLVGGAIHDATFGGRISITYDVPNVGPIAFSEAPKRPNIPTKLQCVPNTDDAKALNCLGVIGDASISIASRQSQADIEKLFNALKPNVAFIPKNTPKVTPTATSTATK